MSRHHLALTDEEQVLVKRIDLRRIIPHGEDGHAIYKSNQEPILALLRSLIARNALPKQRIAYWTDPQFQSGRLKGSHKSLFERNDCRGEEIYTHPHFIPFLSYFLFGADLPAAAIAEFEEQVGDPRWFGGSDIIPLTKKTRAIVRKYQLKDHSRADEFHKLAIDNGLNHYHAESVRKAAATAAQS